MLVTYLYICLLITVDMRRVSTHVSAIFIGVYPGF
jgi:hypothetical protein